MSLPARSPGGEAVHPARPRRRRHPRLEEPDQPRHAARGALRRACDAHRGALQRGHARSWPRPSAGWASRRGGRDARARSRSSGRGGDIPAADAQLSVGLAGTAARFLTALCASAKRGTFRIDGVPRMREAAHEGPDRRPAVAGRRRPVPRDEGFLPVEIRRRGLRGGAGRRSTPGRAARCSRRSSWWRRSPTRPTVATPVGGVRMPFVRMTLRQMAQFGIESGRRSAIRRDP